MKEKIKGITKRWIENNSTPVARFETREISTIKKEDVVLIGMRRTGKTEYLKYRYALLNQHSMPQVSDTMMVPISDMQENLNTIFVNFDDPIFSTTDFKNIESPSWQLISDGIEELIVDENISLILIDEIQRRTNWTTWLKGMKDKYPEITFVATGSDATAMLNGNEFGGSRFKIVYMGNYTYSDYVRGADVQSPTFIDYVDHNFLPSRELSGDYEGQYSQIIEKQMQSRKITREIISAVIRYISFFPGIKLNASRIAKSISDEGTIKLDGKQVKTTLEFLIESQLIFKIENSLGKSQISTKSSFRYYCSNFNTYRYFSGIREYGKTEPGIRLGFVFENIIISNIYSSLRTELDRQKLTFLEKGNRDVDFSINGMNCEIKSYDLFDESSVTLAAEATKKMANFTNPVIIHTGITKEVGGIKFINHEELLRGELWKTWQQ